MKNTSQHFCDKTMDGKMALIPQMLFSELQNTLVNEVTFVGLWWWRSLLPHHSGSAPDQALPQRLRRTLTSLRTRILTNHLVVYCVKRSLQKHSLITLFNQAHWPHPQSHTRDFSHLWKHRYSFTCASFQFHTVAQHGLLLSVTVLL